MTLDPAVPQEFRDRLDRKEMMETSAQEVRKVKVDETELQVEMVLEV